MEKTLSIQETTVENQEIEQEEAVDETINLYPIIRHIFLTLCILLAVSIILFLIYQNGKSIYVEGI